jgi:hypothetical protein
LGISSRAASEASFRRGDNDEEAVASVTVLGLAATAMAEYQIDFDPTMLPAGHGYPSCTAMIGDRAGFRTVPL